MPTVDRRSGGDRRSSERHQLVLDIQWEAPSGRWKGTMNDIARGGCFVLSSGEVEDGDYVRLDFPLIMGGTAAFWGIVVNHAYDIGFGIQFTALTEAQQEFIDRFIEAVAAS